jgi:WXG100 family type VII secretion target
LAGFRINYNQVVGQANAICDLSGDLDREIQKLENILNSVESSWKGPASTAYQNHLKILIADMRKTKYSMSSVSSTIINVATRIQQEDERQAELATQLDVEKTGEEA